MKRAHPFRRRHERGALLIVAMLLAAAIGVSLASYLKLSTTSLRVSSRSFHNGSAINVAEIGLEQALHALNQNQANGVALATAWTGWTTDTSAHTAKRTFGDYTLAPNTTGSVKVYVLNYDLNGAPVMVAKSTVAFGDGSPALSKYLEVELDRRSMWSYGLVGKDWVRMNSNAKVDSWRSDPDNSSATAAEAYSSGARRDKGTVGTTSGSNGALRLDSNAEIYGTANTGGGTVTTSSNVRIYDSTSPSNPKVDTDNINTDFSFTFPEIIVPAPTSVNNITSSWGATNVSLPRTGDVAEGGVYYYNFASGTNVMMDSNKTITISQPAVFLFKNHSGVLSFQLKSNATVNVVSTASVTIYTNGNIQMDSNNNMNIGNQAQKCMIYGTHPSSQLFDFDSNVQITACIYAPFATINMDSNTDIFGAVIGKAIQMDSNSEFHYDESLANLGGSGGYRVAQWKELQTDAERAEYTAELDF